MKKLRVAIIGTGNIGTDLLLKASRSPCVGSLVFVGRREDSPGIKIARDLGVAVSTLGLDYFIQNENSCDVVFDCTDAFSAIENFKVFKRQGIKTIDLTPAKLGPLCVPYLNDNLIISESNVNMITCGGQASIPMLSLVSKYCDDLEYIEVVSQVASKSAGMATRINIDEYINTTEIAIKQFTGVKNCKVILNLNPADPCVDMQTTMFLKCKSINSDGLLLKIDEEIKRINSYVPFYGLTSLPSINENDILIISIKVKGCGDYLPAYAGNLDIINCAALKVCEKLVI